MDFPSDLEEATLHQLSKVTKGDGVLDPLQIRENLCAELPDYPRDLVSSAIKHFGAKMGMRVFDD